MRVLIQYFLPHHFLSRLVRKPLYSETPWLKNFFIRRFIARYNVNMADAKETDIEKYPSFNAFFTRALRDDARPIAMDDKAVASPVDGKISAIGALENALLLQAKGFTYSLHTLLGEKAELTRTFQSGLFSTLYLAPRDYHRIHMPYSGTLLEMHFIPGRLFSVNAQTTERVPQLFTRNARLVCVFDTSLGKMAVIFVGALFVGTVATVWEGTIQGSERKSWKYDPSQTPLFYSKGQEIGRFMMGSTVIMLFENPHIRWEETAKIEKPVQLGEVLGTLA